MYSKSDIASILYANGMVEIFQNTDLKEHPKTRQKSLMVDKLNPEYQSARSLKLAGDALCITGAAIVFSGLMVGLFADMFSGFIIMMPIGAGFALAGISCSVVGNSRMRDIQYNYAINIPMYKGDNTALKLGINANKVGLAFNF